MNVHILMKPAYQRVPEVKQAKVLRSFGNSAQRGGHRLVSSPEQANLLAVWGFGDPAVVSVALKTKRRGGRFVAWDLGYFRRSGSDEERGYRVSVDAMHPDVFERDWPASRWEEMQRSVHDRWDKNGHIVLVGMGYKSAIMYAERPGAWEQSMADKIVARFRNPLIFRPKPINPKNCQRVHGASRSDSKSPIEALLDGAYLAVCRHSNVAVDALMHGIPAVTFGGAASAIFPSDLSFDHQPVSNSLRLRFLRNLSWFEWTLNEINSGLALSAIEKMLGQKEMAA